MDGKKSMYQKPEPLAYGLARFASFPVSAFLFRRKFLRNELRGVKGPCVVLANHQASLDFVNLIGATRRRVTFVISSSFYSSLPIRGILDRMHVIPKQQFQTSVSDLKRMKAVVDSGEILVLYPAGLMCEDGLSTPIPEATYKFLKWIKADIYMARTKGTYFAMPKWTRGIRAGRTYLDIYKLFDKEELAEMDTAAIRQRAEPALLFDAYREQEELRVPYTRNDDIRGLENVLYVCPRCRREFTVGTKGTSALRCGACGYEEESDRLGFLHPVGGAAPELRYVSDWSRLALRQTKEELKRTPDFQLSALTRIHMIDAGHNRFAEVGSGRVTLDRSKFRLEGLIRGERVSLDFPTTALPMLPFSPGKRIELQSGPVIYRCVLEDGRLAMKFINILKALHELNYA